MMQNEVRSSPSMSKVFTYLRTNRFPGFEEVWLSLLENLEYRPPTVNEVVEEGE